MVTALSAGWSEQLRSATGCIPRWRRGLHTRVPRSVLNCVTSFRLVPVTQHLTQVRCVKDPIGGVLPTHRFSRPLMVGANRGEFPLLQPGSCSSKGIVTP